MTEEKINLNGSGTLDAARTQLREQGIALLRGVFPTDSLAALKEAATRCFEAVEAGQALPEHYKFNRYSHSLLLTALTGFGCEPDDLTAPLAAAGLESLFSEAMHGAWAGSMEQSWVRKKIAPMRAPAGEYQLQGWHQDGALGVRFPSDAAPDAMAAIPMTQLLTCWIPLDACGADSPGLEFVRGRQPKLLHFSELDDASVRRRFDVEEFWAPELAFGDGLIFLKSVLHRTYTCPEMTRDRMSVEFRIFPSR
ncbi:MAG TPA: phytanoyl-CoA dioxygenase family protein [Acidobacteriaceae bacterium]|nr:phytanoyl-CoA dioxygenase family protein [Acidobacteriaceae bacterium]